MAQKFVDPRFAKSGEYKNVISTIAKIGKCPFCPANFKYHKNPILKTKGNWLITKASWPYKNTAYHFLVIGKKHKEKFLELKSKDWQEITYLVSWVITKFRIKGGGLAMRFGETKYTGATVLHLHAHLIVPRLKPGKKASKTVNFPVG